MKVMNVMLAVIFALSMCMVFHPAEIQAASKKKDVMSSVEKKVKKAKKSAGKKASKKRDVKRKVTKKVKKARRAAKKVKKDIPKNVNVNSAKKDVLMMLPGIGPVTADAIIKYRKSNGKFKNINDLLDVKGIGDKTLAKIKPYLKKI